MRIFTKNAFTRLTTDLSLHLIPELRGFNTISQIARIYAQCMVGNSFSLYDLKTLCPILESRSWFAKRSLYAFFVLSLVFHSASFAGDVVLSTRSNRSSPNAENIELRILAAISFLLLLHLAFNYKNYKNTYLEFFQAFIDGFTISLTSGNNFSSNKETQLFTPILSMKCSA